MERHMVLGKRLPRVDGLEKVTGQAQYADDIVLPNMLRGKVLRSPYPHARILNIDTSRAEKLPGVVAVASAKDLPLVRYGASIQDETAFAVDRVRYVGEAVAAVAAVDLETAKEALRLLQVEYEEQPAVFNAHEALKPGGPLVHEEVHTYKHLPGFMPVEGTNICYHYKLRRGDVEVGFGESDLVLEDTYQVPMAHHGYIEPPVAVCWFDQQGRATVWSPSAKPYGLRKDLAVVFQLPMSKMRVMTCRVGGSFGGKNDARLEHIGLALARKAGRPVKMSMTRSESFTSAVVRHPVTIRVKTGVKKDGTLHAREMEITWNTGAYSASGGMLCKNSGHSAPGPYKIPHVKVDSLLVYTNNPIAGAMRGFGCPQISWAVESQMDEIAERLGIDPVDLRLRNAVEERSLCYDGQVLHSVGLKETIREVAAQTEGRRGRLAPGWGTGFACSQKSVISGTSSAAFVKINEDGTCVVMSSTVEVGQGSDTVKAQIAAEELGLRVEDIVVVAPDTDTTPYDFGTVASRGTFHMGNAVRLAAADARQKLFLVAADRLEANTADLEAVGGMVRVKGSPERGVPIAVLAAESVRGQGPILGQGSYIHNLEVTDPETGKPAEPSAFYIYGAQAAEVRVDLETGGIDVNRIVASYDVGRVINPATCEGQVEGQVIMGLGATLYEEMLLDGGRVLNPNFRDYKMPTMPDTPEIRSALVEVPHAEGPFGAKGVGEAVTVTTPATISNAVYQAVGVRMKSLPITPEKLFWAMKDKRPGSGS